MRWRRGFERVSGVMVTRWLLLAVSLLLVARTTAHAGDATAVSDSQARWALFKPDQISWRDGPPSLLTGAKMAVLEGDPAKEGFFTIRLKLPDGFRVLPHWHPKTERLTVISGTVNLGTGEQFDPNSKAILALPAGTYSSMPPKMAHFAWMKGETILQLSSIGPWEVVYVNPADDPRAHPKQ